jgi:hypothetical protein
MRVRGYPDPDRPAAKVLTVPCPRCDAKAGSSCRTPGGGRVHASHAVRWDKAYAEGVLVDTPTPKADVPVPGS